MLGLIIKRILLAIPVSMDSGINYFHASAYCPRRTF